MLETLYILAPSASAAPSLIPSHPQTLSTPNPICAPPTERKVSPNVTSGFLSLGLSKCCSLSLENIYSVLSHPILMSSRVSSNVPSSRKKPLRDPQISSVCNGTLYSEGLSHCPKSLGYILSFPLTPLPRPSVPKPHPSCPWDLSAPSPPTHPHSPPGPLPQPPARHLASSLFLIPSVPYSTPERPFYTPN